MTFALALSEPIRADTYNRLHFVAENSMFGDLEDEIRKYDPRGREDLRKILAVDPIITIQRNITMYFFYVLKGRLRSM